MNLKESISLSCVGACVLSLFSHVQLFTTLWTVAHQAPLSMGFSGQEYWSGLPCPPLGDFPHPRIDTVSPAAPCIEGGLFTAEPPRKPFLLVVSGKTSLTSKESACKECIGLDQCPLSAPPQPPSSGFSTELPGHCFPPQEVSDALRWILFSLLSGQLIFFPVRKKKRFSQADYSCQ